MIVVKVYMSLLKSSQSGLYNKNEEKPWETGSLPQRGLQLNPIFFFASCPLIGPRIRISKTSAMYSTWLCVYLLVCVWGGQLVWIRRLQQGKWITHSLTPVKAFCSAMGLLRPVLHYQTSLDQTSLEQGKVEKRGREAAGKEDGIQHMTLPLNQLPPTWIRWHELG